MPHAKEDSPFPQDLVPPSQIRTTALIQDIKDRLGKKEREEEGEEKKRSSHLAGHDLEDFLWKSNQ